MRKTQIDMLGQNPKETLIFILFQGSAFVLIAHEIKHNNKDPRRINVDKVLELPFGSQHYF
jgi:hypothetical protein